MDEKLIREAVGVLESKISVTNTSVAEAQRILIDFANSYISAIEGGVPNEQQVYCDMYRPMIDQPSISKEYLLGFNKCRFLFLPLLAKLKMENEGLKSSGDNRVLYIAKLQSTLMEKEKEIKAKLAKKDLHINLEQMKNIQLVNDYTLEIDRLKISLAEKDQRIAELEHSQSKPSLEMIEEIIANSSLVSIHKKKYSNVTNFMATWSGLPNEIKTLAQAIADLINGKGSENG